MHSVCWTAIEIGRSSLNEIGNVKAEMLNEPSQTAAECSPERKPGEYGPFKIPKPALAGNRAKNSVAPTGLTVLFRCFPRAYARGYTLSPSSMAH